MNADRNKGIDEHAGHRNLLMFHFWSLRRSSICPKWLMVTTKCAVFRPYFLSGSWTDVYSVYRTADAATTIFTTIHSFFVVVVVLNCTIVYDCYCFIHGFDSAASMKGSILYIEPIAHRQAHMLVVVCECGECGHYGIIGM